MFWRRRAARPYPGDLVIPGGRNAAAIVTTVTDNFIGLGSAFLLSLRENLKDFDAVDVVLLQAPEVAPLSAEHRLALTRLLPRLRIVDVDLGGALTPGNMVRYDAAGRPTEAGPPSKKAAYVKLNVLRMTGYDKVLLMDSDLLVLDDFSELLRLPFDIAAVGAGPTNRRGGVRHVPAGSGRGNFNSGVLLLGRSARGRRHFEDAIHFLDTDETRMFRDQSALNAIFRDREKLMLPPTYNYKLDFTTPGAIDDQSILASAKILHFVASAKWRLREPRHAGTAIYDRFHEVQARTGLPFILSR